MSSRVEAALEATGLYEKYFERFLRAGMNDMAVTLCLKMSLKTLELVVSSPEDYSLFIEAFTNPESAQINRDLNSPREDENGSVSDSLEETEDISNPRMSTQNCNGSFRNSSSTSKVNDDNNQALGNTRDPVPDDLVPKMRPDSFSSTSQPTSDPNDSPLINECFNVYAKKVQHIKSPSHKNSFVLPAELESIHNTAITSIMEIFESKDIPQDEKDASDKLKSKDILLQRIEQLHQRIISLNNHAFQSALKDATLQLREYIQNLMQDKIQNPHCSTPDPVDVQNKREEKSESNSEADFVIVQDNKAVFKECEVLSLEFFQKLLSLDNIDSCRPAKAVFQETLDSLKAQYNIPLQSDCTKLESDGETDANTIATQLWNRYRSSILQKILKPNRFLPLDQLQNIQDSTRKETLKYLTTELFRSSSDIGIVLQIQDRFLLEIQKYDSDEYNFTKIVEEQNRKYLTKCNQLIAKTVDMQRRKIQVNFEPDLLSAMYFDSMEELPKNLRNIEGFSSLPKVESDMLVLHLSTSLSDLFQDVVDKWCPRKRQDLLQNYKDSMNKFCCNVGISVAFGYGSIYTSKILKDDEVLVEEHKKQKSLVLNELQNLLERIPMVPFRDANKNAENCEDFTKILVDFEVEIDEHFKTIQETNTLLKGALKENSQGFLCQAKSKYSELVHNINKTFHSEEAYRHLCNTTKDDVKRSFQDQCNSKLEPRNKTEVLLTELQEFMEALPETKLSGESPDTLEIIGPTLKFSRDLAILENNIKSCSTVSSDDIKEVRCIASKEILMDENLCGDFWSGKNLVLYTKKILVVGNERIVDVSGNGTDNGKTYSDGNISKKPDTPKDPGENGLHGEDGIPGKNGGNIMILTNEIKFSNLNIQICRLISNGTPSGNGQPGGDGSNGKDGMDGDLRFQMSLEELERRFPSAASFLGSRSAPKLKKGLDSLEKLAQVEILDCVNADSRCYSIVTKEGASISYGFFQGNIPGLKGFKGLKGEQSFYVWCQGAPGNLGQRGGLGGFGGRGGSPGKPGEITISLGKGSINEIPRNILIVRREGRAGSPGEKGSDGKNGKNGKPGTDFAFIDSYSGVSHSKTRYSGFLKLKTVEDKDSQTNKGTAVAFCPHRRKYITFVEIQGNESKDGNDEGVKNNSLIVLKKEVRKGIKVFDDPKEHPERPPLEEAQVNKEISREELESKYNKLFKL